MNNEQQCREAYIKWLWEEQQLDSEWDDERNCFKDFPAHLAYKAWSAAQAAKAQPIERGPWSVEHEDHYVALLSDDFTHDVSLRVSGDFADTQQKIAYANEIARRLNNAQQEQPQGKEMDEGYFYKRLEAMKVAQQEQQAQPAPEPMTDEQIMTLALSHEAGTNWDSALSNDPELFDTDVLFSRDDFLSFARALLSAAQPPAGYVLVPETPTQEMCIAGQEKAREWPSFPLRIVPIYQAMLAAAPYNADGTTGR